MPHSPPAAEQTIGDGLPPATIMTSLPLQPLSLNGDSRIYQTIPQLPMKMTTANANDSLPDTSIQQHQSSMEHPNKFQRLENDAQTGDLKKGIIPDLKPISLKSDPISTQFNYFASIRAQAQQLNDSLMEDGRISLIPDIPHMDVQAYMAPTPKTAWQLAQEPTPFLSLGDAYLNGPLGGGLSEGITEVVGEAACGKTQLAMQLLLQCQLPLSEGGLDGGALFLAMGEGDFPINRLRSLADSFKERHPKVQHDMLQRIYIRPILNPAELWTVLQYSLRPSLESGDVKLIVMDSIAAMFRTEQTGMHKEKDMNFEERSQDLLRLAAQLKQYSSTYHIPVMVINQVTDFFPGSDGNSGNQLRMEEVKHSYLHHWSMMSSGRRVLPALGLTWANCVTTRIFLTRKHEFVTADTPSRLLPSSQQFQQYQQQQQQQSTSLIDLYGVTPLVNMFTGPGSNSVAMRPSIPPTMQQPQQPAFFPSTPPPTQMRRFLHVQFAPHLAQSSVEFVIESSGMRGLATAPDPALLFSPPSPTMHSSPGQPTNQRMGSTPTALPCSSRSYASNPAATFQSQPPSNFLKTEPISTPAATTSYFKNMYTPAGGAETKTSYFDDDQLTAEQADEEALALARAEAEMQLRQQQKQLLPTTQSSPSQSIQAQSTVAVSFSPMVLSPSMQQQFSPPPLPPRPTPTTATPTAIPQS